MLVKRELNQFDRNHVKSMYLASFMFINFQFFSLPFANNKGGEDIYVCFSLTIAASNISKILSFKYQGGALIKGELTLLGEAKLIKVSMSCHLQLFILIKTNLEHLFFFFLILPIFPFFFIMSKGGEECIYVCVFSLSP
jgi:hypothetical protein